MHDDTKQLRKNLIWQQIEKGKAARSNKYRYAPRYFAIVSVYGRATSRTRA